MLRFMSITALCSILLTSSANAQVSIIPTSPSAFETVRVFAPYSSTGYYVPGETLVTMNSNRITVTLVAGVVGVPPPTPDLDVAIGQLPPGTYDVDVLRPGGQVVGSTQFVIGGGSKPTRPNYTDLWWNRSESGWGISITQHDPTSTIFLLWYVYGPDGKPTWYSISNGEWTGTTRYRGQIYKTTGPPLGGPFNPADVTRTPAGTGTLDFHAYNSATFSYTIDGLSGSKEIERLGF